uniref:RNA-binding domain-containing protein n=2 Tax=Roseivirga sp. TaxID=1964215 RepID=UPI0040487BE3
MKVGDVNYIQDLLQKKESATLEFKAHFDKVEAAKVICSFLNRDGGQLVIGVGDSQKVTGLKYSNKIALEFQNYLIAEIVPEPAISVDIQKVEKKDVLVISVWKGTHQPYIYNGGVYYRVGATTVQANSKQLAELIHKETDRNQRWETKSAIEVDVEDIDLSEVLECIKDANSTGREQSLPDNPLQFLSKYGLYKNGDFTNAAVILFGKKPVKYFPQVRVRLSVFNTNKTGEKLLYDKIFEDNLFKSIRQLTDFFDLAFGVSSSFQSTKWTRTDKVSFPRLAIREAILNAFVHRDYSSFSSSIAVNIYSDKLQVNSYGSLPKGITIKSLSEDHLSIPVNPDIAHIFFLRGWIEKIGIGTVKMIEHCKALGFKPPMWKLKDNAVSVTFPDVVVPFNFNEGITEGITEGINILIDDAIREGITEGITEGVKESMIQIVSIILTEKSVRASEIAEKLKKSYKTLERHIVVLKQINAIEYKGSNRTGGYEVTEKFSSLIKQN